MFQLFDGPVNYYSDGEWREIDTTLVETATGFEPTAHNLEINFPRQLTPQSGPELRLGDASITMRLQGVARSEGSPTGDRVTYQNALRDVDATYVATTMGLAERLSLRSPAAPSTFAYRIDTENIELEQDASGNITLSSGDVMIGSIPTGIAEESVDGLQAGGGDAITRVDQALQQLGPGSYRLITNVPAEWLDDPDTQYPVLVDPEVVTQLAQPSCTRPGSTYDPPISAEPELHVSNDKHCFYRHWPWKDSYVDSTSTGVMEPNDPLVTVGQTSPAEYRAFFDFPVFTSPDGVDQIYEGKFGVYNYYSQPVSLPPLKRIVNLRRILKTQNGQPWTPETLKWSNQPSVALAITDELRGCGNNIQETPELTCTPWHVFDVTKILQLAQDENWGPEEAMGWRLASTESNSRKRYYSRNESASCRCMPYLLATANSQPSDPIQTGPSEGQWVTTNRPTLTVGNVTDDNNDAVYVKYEISTDNNFSEFNTAGENLEEYDPNELYDSGWVPETGSHQVQMDLAAGGPYYWRVRSWDRYSLTDGTGGPHLQPTSATRTFRVDHVPPTEPHATSTSHVRDVPYQDRTVDMIWTSSTDAHSGLAGYSWAFSTNENLVLDKTIESGASATSTTSGPLDDETWYFHIVAVDNAGNKSEQNTYGPMIINQNGLVVPIEQVAQSDMMGLEQFMPFRLHSMGPTATAYVNLRNGNAVVTGGDVTVPGIGLNAVVSHTYNSGRADTNTGVGKGWTLSVSDLDTGVLEGLSGAASNFDLNAPLEVGPILNSTGQIVGSVLEFVDGDGTTHRFVRNSATAGGRWLSPPGVNLRVRERPGPPGKEAYELIRPDGVTYRAELCLAGTSATTDPCEGDHVTGEWRVVKITDRNDNELSFDYVVCRPDIPSASCGQSSPIPVIRVAAVNHDAVTVAPLVSFLYDDRANLEYIVSLPGRIDSDSSTVDDQRTLRYEVDAQDLLQSIEVHPGDSANRRITRFDYLGQTSSLIGVGDPRTHWSHLEYDGKDRVKKFIDREDAEWSYSYGPIGSDAQRNTTVTAPPPSATTQVSDYPQTAYRTSGRHTVASDDPRLTGGNILRITDPGNNTGSIVEEFEWEENLLAKKVDGLDNETRMRYNALGLVEEIDAPSMNDPGFAPDGAPTDRIVTRITYAAYDDPDEDDSDEDYPSGSCNPPNEDPGNQNSNSRVNDSLYCEDVADIVRTTSGIVRTDDDQTDPDDDPTRGWSTSSTSRAGTTRGT